MKSKSGVATNDPSAESGTRLLTRAQVARALGVGVSTVRRLEGRVLHPVVGIDGIHRFDPREVEEHQASSGAAPRAAAKPPRERSRKGSADPGVEGKRHARAFRLFEAGRSHAEVVIEAALPSHIVRQLHEEWRAGYRRPAPPPAEDTEPAARPRDEAAEWAEWERQMQQLSSEFAPRDARTRSGQGRRTPRWRRWWSPR